MPEAGPYEKKPRPESIKMLIEYLGGNPIVKSVRQTGDQLVEITRSKGSDLTVFMTNIYIVSEADVEEITAKFDVDAIVTMSAWNGYTTDAKVAARAKGVGLFKFREFLGAVYYAGNKFLDYTPPDADKKRVR